MAVKPRQALYGLLVASFAAKLLYVFWLTDYSNYLFSDFYGYWERALDRLAGRDLDGTQWAIWPPLPHIVLSWLLRIVDALGLSAYRLEVVLGVNVFLSTLNVAIAYGIALRLSASSRAALGAAAVLVCFYPLAYLNAFVMSEHPATTALLGALWVLVYFPSHRGWLFCSGMLLALATGLRPAFGLIALPCGLYALFGNPFSRLAIGAAASFSAGFLLVVAGVAAEVGRISHGEVRGLSANGGVSFYFAQCRTHEVTARTPPYHFNLVPPATVAHPENGRLESPRPFHQQKFYFELGWRCLRAQPSWPFESLLKLGDLVFGPLLPSVSSARGFDTLLPPFRWIALGMLLGLPLALCVVVASRRRAAAGMLGGTILASLLTYFAFNAEHRYLYPLLPIVTVLDAWAIVEVYRQWRRVSGYVIGYAVMVAIAMLALGIHAAWQRHSNPTLIHAKWLRSPTAVSAAERMGEFAIDTLRLPEGEELRHPLHGKIDIPDPREFAIEFRTCLDVPAAEQFEFVVAADDGFELWIDEERVASHRSPARYVATRATVRLAAGLHRYRLLYAQEHGRLGVSATWRKAIDGGKWMPAVGLRDIGSKGSDLSFLPPEACPASRR